MDTPRTPEEMREIFEACADLVREQGKDAVPMTSLAVGFGLMWHAFDEDEAVEFFRYLVALHGSEGEHGALPWRRPPRARRFRSWFS